MLFILMLGFGISSYKSALISLATAIIVALCLLSNGDSGINTMDIQISYSIVGWSLIEGFLKAILPILLIIIMAIYSYNILVISGSIEIIKSQFNSFTSHKGILVLTIVWGFGGLLEGMAGFGTSVAIPAAILISLGFKPIYSAIVSLLGNTIATSFGAVGVPVITLANITCSSGSASTNEIIEISSMIIIQLAPLFIIIPFIILTLTDKNKLKSNLILATSTGIISFASQYLCAHFIGAETPAIIGSVVIIIFLYIYGKYFYPSPENVRKKLSTSAICKAWSIYLIIIFLIFIAGPLSPRVHDFINEQAKCTFSLPVIDSSFSFNIIGNASFLLFLGSLSGGIIQGLSIKQLLLILFKTIYELRYTTITIISLICISSVMNHSGMVTEIALSFAGWTGEFYPVVAPFIGALGTFVTGSDTSSNILFGKLQMQVADNLGMTSNASFFGLEGNQSTWIIASNSAGASGGKMISPQSIAIATASCNMKNNDDIIMKKALPYATLYLVILCSVVVLGMIC